MTVQIDELGPVDWLVWSSPEAKFHGEIAPALDDLIERGIVRVLDLLILKKDADGSLEAFEVADVDESEIGQLRAYEAELATLLGEDDVAAIAEAPEPGSSAACIVYEHTWAAAFASAMRRAGGQLGADGRIPVQALLAASAVQDAEGA